MSIKYGSLNVDERYSGILGLIFITTLCWCPA